MSDGFQPGSGVAAIMRNSAYVLGSAWLATIVRALYMLVLARGLGPSDYGLLSSSQAFYLMFVAVAADGLPAYLAKERAAGANREASSTLGALILQAVALLVGAVVFATIGVVAEGNDTEKAVFLLFAAAIVARGLAICARHMFVAYEAGEYQLKLVAVFRLAEMTAGILALALGADIVLIAAIHLISYVLEALVALKLFNTRLVALASRTARTWQFRAVAAGLLPISIAIAAGNWLRLAPLALSQQVADTGFEVGQFTLAWNAALILSTFLVAAMNAAFPIVSRARARNDAKDDWYLDFCVRYGVLLSAAAAIGAMSFGPAIITAATGTTYARAGVIFTAAVGLVGPVVVNYALDQIIFLRERTGLVLVINGAALLAVLAGFIPAFHVFGPVGAVLAVTAVLALLVVVKAFVLKLLAHANILPSLLRAAAIAALAILVAAPLMQWSALAGFTLGLCVLIFLGLVAGVTPSRELREFGAVGLWRRQK